MKHRGLINLLGIAQPGNSSAAGKHPPVPGEVGALMAGCFFSPSGTSTAEILLVCSPKPDSIQQLASAAWSSAG